MFLPSTVDLQALQEEEQYDDILNISDSEDDLSLQQFDEEVISSVTIAFTPDIMTPSSRRSSAFEDDSISISHERSYFESFKFELALGLWCEDIGISRTQYSSLRDIFRMLEPHSELNKLSESYATLKSHINRQLPLLQMRKKIISLRSEKMATAAEDRKSTESGKILTEDLIFFDLKNVFQSFLSSAEYRQKMHVGMAHFVDVSCELWHSHS